MNKNTIITGLGVAAIVLAFTLTFTVSETEKAILLEFKKFSSWPGSCFLWARRRRLRRMAAEAREVVPRGEQPP